MLASGDKPDFEFFKMIHFSVGDWYVV